MAFDPVPPSRAPETTDTTCRVAATKRSRGTPLVIGSRCHEGVTRIQVRGELDEAHNPQLRGALRQSIEAGEADIVLDLCGVPYVSQGALGVLVGALKAQQGRGGTLRLAGPCAQVRDKLVQTQLIRVFAVEEAAAL